MGIPSPSPDQIVALTEMKAVAEAGVSGAADKIAAIQGAIDKQQEIEDYQKSVFDSLNDDIIGRYENERKYLSGENIQNPIVEIDVTSFAAKDDTGRLWNSGDYVPNRIAEFDGGQLIHVEDNNEVDLFTEQNDILDKLQNGYSGQILIDVGATIKDAIDNVTTQLIIEDNTATINIDDVLFIAGGSKAALIKVTVVSSGGYCTGETPPGSGVDETTCLANGGTWTDQDTIDFEYLIKPDGTIPAGSDIGQKTFNGFNNTERDNKVASDSDFQPFMDVLLSDLKNVFDNRKIALQSQINELQNNDDDDLDLTAETKANTSLIAINVFLGTTPPSTIDISDVGISAINTEKNTRQPEVSARISAIAAAIISGDYFNQRFSTTEGRCRLNNGSISLLNTLNIAKSGAQSGAIEAQGLSDRYGGLIP